MNALHKRWDIFAYLDRRRLGEIVGRKNQQARREEEGGRNYKPQCRHGDEPPHTLPPPLIHA